MAKSYGPIKSCVESLGQIVKASSGSSDVTGKKVDSDLTGMDLVLSFEVSDEPQTLMEDLS